MIFDLMSQEDDIASARQAAGISEQGGAMSVLRRILWRYFLVLWSLVGMAVGLKAVAFGAFVIWIGHPILIGMRLSQLTKRNRVIADSGQHRWYVSMGGVPEQVKILSLKNVLFHSQEEMRSVLISFCRVRFLLYVSAVLIAGLDVSGLWLGSGAAAGPSQWHVAMALATIAFFAWRSVAYYRLLRLGQRQDWHVSTTSVDGCDMYAAYKRCQGKNGDYYVPYLLATFSPQVV